MFLRFRLPVLHHLFCAEFTRCASASGKKRGLAYFLRGAPDMHPVKSRSLITIETNQLLCCARAETERTRVSKFVSEPQMYDMRIESSLSPAMLNNPELSLVHPDVSAEARLTARVLLRYDQRLITGQILRGVFTHSRCVAPRSQTGLRPVKLV